MQGCSLQVWTVFFAFLESKTDQLKNQRLTIQPKAIQPKVIQNNPKQPKATQPKVIRCNRYGSIQSIVMLVCMDCIYSVVW